MTYNNLYENLRKIDLGEPLYGDLVSKAASYYSAAAIRESASMIDHPSLPQLENQVLGTRSELVEVVKSINIRLSTHQPPLPSLPVEKEDLDGLVFSLMGDLFRARPKA